MTDTNEIIKSIRDFGNKLDKSEWVSEIQNNHILNLIDSEKGMQNFDVFLKIIDSAPSLRNLPQEAGEDVKALLEKHSMEYAMDTFYNISLFVEPFDGKKEAEKSLEGLAEKGYPCAQFILARALMQEGQKQFNLTTLNKIIGIFDDMQQNPYSNKVEVDMARHYSEECKKTQAEKIRQKQIQDAIFQKV